MKTLLLLTTASVGLAAGAADAATISFAGYQTALNPGEFLVTNFDNPLTTASGFTLTGNAAFLTGSSSNGAAPAFSDTQRDPTQYLSIEAGQKEVLSTPALKEISFYVGSLDSYNELTFSFVGGGTQSFSGNDLAGAVTQADNGDQQAVNTNGRYTFTFGKAIDGVTLASSQNSFEISNIGAAGVPEPTTWAMMLVGFGGLGGMLRGNRRKPVAA
ncbi:MAG TPA: PEPxxWA-CTERM sorting domain-containing protein [Caulobacteraceae bacterium]|jgi:hypothetical protein|nr:PEPxxWA-CTERM sorting domain-containing protein [Caulobacteraceae bacterium]